MTTAPGPDDRSQTPVVPNAATAGPDDGTVDDPETLAAEILALARPTLVVFDCDGVLAPLVAHADDSVLLGGVGEALTRLASIDGVTVAILSGRSLAGLDQFGFDDSIVVAGSYGGERRGRDAVPLDGAETELLTDLDALVTEAAERAGPGAWVERKPTSVVVHVFEADAERGAAALEWTWDRQTALTGHECHTGHQVLELMARPTNKGRGLDALRTEFAAASTVYFGDDLPDEDAFARLGADDLGVKVGAGPTDAGRRLVGPESVLAILTAMVQLGR